MLMCALLNVVVFAQNGGGGADLDVKVTENSGGGNIPWTWIIGGIVLLVLLIALLSGRGRDRVVEKRTVVKD